MCRKVAERGGEWMTNREKLIELLTERNGEVKSTHIKRFIYGSPLIYCEHYDRCEDYRSCNECVAKWLNEEVES